MTFYPYQWPQNALRIPTGDARGMPPVDGANRQARRESFTMSGSFTITSAVPGQQFRLTLPTDQDGDFWCDQIYLVGWVTAVSESVEPDPGFLQITDLRTARRLCWPEIGMSLKFPATLILFSDDPGFDVAGSPLPDGFRSTSTLPQPFCFSRQGGIELVLTVLFNIPATTTRTIDIALGGWKEYAYAAEGR